MNFGNMKKVAKIISSKSSSTTSSELPPPLINYGELRSKLFHENNGCPLLFNQDCLILWKTSSCSIYGVQQVTQFFITLKIMISRKNDKKGYVFQTTDLLRNWYKSGSRCPLPPSPLFGYPLFSWWAFSVFICRCRHHPIIGILGYFWGANIHLGSIPPPPLFGSPLFSWWALSVFIRRWQTPPHHWNFGIFLGC